MFRPLRAHRWIAPLIVAALGFSNGVLHAAPGGHGGGPGHAGRPGGFGGPHGPIAPAYRGYYGYPRGYGGFGVGIGFGYGYGWGYPYGYGYPAYVVPAYGAGYVIPEPLGQPVRVAQTEVHFTVRAQPAATVWINGAKSTQSGAVREFVSAGLEPGRTYTYEFSAEWMGPDGKTLEQKRQLSVHAGERIVIEFADPPAQLDVLPEPKRVQP